MSDLVGNECVCVRCGHSWVARKEGPLPRSCPSCRSVSWMKKAKTVTCVRCSHKWNTSCGNPKRCPSCGTDKWNVLPEKRSCLRCGYTWNAKREWMPKRCPSCGSTTWNREIEKSFRKSNSVAVSMNDIKLDQSVIDNILDRYRKGETCTGISVETGISFSAVYAIVCSQNESPKV